MKITMQLTVDGLIRALRIKGHQVASRLETRKAVPARQTKRGRPVRTETERKR